MVWNHYLQQHFPPKIKINKKNDDAFGRKCKENWRILHISPVTERWFWLSLVLWRRPPSFLPPREFGSPGEKEKKEKKGWRREENYCDESGGIG